MRRLLPLLLALLLVPVAVAFAAQSATTGAAQDVTATTATITGSVDPGGQATTAVAEYGTSTQYGTTTSAQDVGSGTGAVPVSRPLTGLAPGTTYHYRVVARTGSGQVVGDDRTFTTAAAPPPTATTGGASGVSSTGATVSATVDPRGAATHVVFEYGPSTSYGSTSAARDLPATAAATTVTAALRGLAPGQAFHYRVRATSASGTDLGADRTFTTSRPAAPTVVGTGAITDVSAGAAVVNATIDPKGRDGKVSLEFGTSASRLTSKTAPLDVSGGRQGVKLLAVPLKASTRFYVRVVLSTDGGTARGTTKSFTTPAAPAVGALTIAGQPIVAGRTAVLTGRLAGPGAAGAPVVLEGTPHPFSNPFTPLGATAVADASGAFTLRTVVTERTRVRVRADLGGTAAYGPVAAIKVRPGVRVTTRRLSGGRVRLSGTIRPAGGYAVSLRRDGRRVKAAAVRGGRFSVTVRRRAGRYAIRVVRRDRSLVTFTTAERRLSAR